MKKILLVLLASVLAISFTACGQSGDSGGSSQEPVDGGWAIYSAKSPVTLPADVQRAFDKATAELTGNQIVPVTFVGEQVVAGPP